MRPFAGLLLAVSAALGFVARAGATDSAPWVAPVNAALFNAVFNSPSRFGVHADDVAYIRGLPVLFKVSIGRYDLDVSPHANVDQSGASAEAGATVRLGVHLQNRVISGMNQLGVPTVDGATFGDRGRWYLFAGASGSTVGFNMTRDAQGQFRRAGWSADSASSLLSDAQAGLGWRKGDMQASIGYVHREIVPMIPVSSVGDGKISDSMVAFSLSLHSR